jgi:hypothetical protein
MKRQGRCGEQEEKYKYDHMEEKGREKIISSITHFSFT